MTNNSPKITLNFHPKQGELLVSQATEILYGGAAGGGKSFAMRACAIVWAMQVPGIQIYLFRRTFSDLEFNHMNGPTSFPILLGDFIQKKKVTWNKSKYSFTFWNGSTIHLCHCQREDDRYNYLGAEIHVLLIDELSQFTPKIYQFLRTRVRMVGITVPENVTTKFPKIVCGSNPGGPCHSMMRSSWVDRAPPMAIWKAPEAEGGMYRQFIPARIRDNPSLEKEDPNYKNRIMGMGDSALVRAYLDGDFNILIGGMFDDVWSPEHHVIQPFVIPYSWHVNRAYDHGSAKPFSVGFWAESDGTDAVMADGTKRSFPRGTLFRIGEWYGWNGKPDEGCRMRVGDIADGIKDIEALFGRNINSGPADSSIFDEKLDKDIATEFSEKGIDWTPADKRPGSRIFGWQRIRSLLEESKKPLMEGPGLFVFSNCEHFIRILPTTARHELNPEEIAKGTEDHVLDETRYRVCDGISMATFGDDSVV